MVFALTTYTLKGGPLTKEEVDANWNAIVTAVNDLEAVAFTPTSIASITQSSASITINLSDGTSAGTFGLPIWAPKGAVEWTASTNYARGDTVYPPATPAGPVYVANNAYFSGADFSAEITAGNIGLLAGTQGPAGATWYTGTGAPAGALGVDGDLYLENATGDVYKRAAGVWAVEANIEGPPANVAAAVADTVDVSDTATQLNALLASLRAAGLLAV